MTIVRDGDVSMLRTPGGMETGSLASPGRGATEILALRQRQQPGGQNPPHRHDREEVMVQVAGTATVSIGDDEMRLSPGDTLIVPAQSVHRVTNVGDEPAEWLLVAPAGLRFFTPDGEEIKPAFVV